MKLNRQTILPGILCLIIIVLLFTNRCGSGKYHDVEVSNSVLESTLLSAKKQIAEKDSIVSHLIDRTATLKDSLKTTQADLVKIKARQKGMRITVKPLLTSIDSSRYFEANLIMCDSVSDVQDKVITELSQISIEQQSTISELGGIVTLERRQNEAFQTILDAQKAEITKLTKELAREFTFKKMWRAIGLSALVVLGVLGALVF